MAAGLLIAIGAAGVTWRMNTGWESVEDYVIDHYQHDGAAVLARADDHAGGECFRRCWPNSAPMWRRRWPAS